MIDSNKVRQKAKDYLRAKEQTRELREQLNDLKEERDEAQKSLYHAIGPDNKIAVALARYGPKIIKPYSNSTEKVHVHDLDMITCNCSHCQ